MTHEQTIAKIKEVLDQLRPNIQMDGGDVEFVRLHDGVVYVQLQGACVGCPISSVTLKAGILEALKEHLSDIHDVVAVQDGDPGGSDSQDIFGM